MSASVSFQKLLDRCKKPEPGSAIHPGSSSILEWLALTLFVIFFVCLGVVYAAGPRLAWTASKFFFTAGLLLFLTGKIRQGKNSPSEARERADNYNEKRT